jgi:hypothetical protein
VRGALLVAQAALSAACPAVFELDEPSEQIEPTGQDADLAASPDAGAPGVGAGSGGFTPTEPQRVAGTPASAESDGATRCQPILPLPDVGATARSGAKLPAAQPPAPTAQPPAPTAQESRPLKVVVSAADALRAIEAAGFSLPCQGAHVQELADGFEVAATMRTKLCPREQFTVYLLHVSKSGRIEALAATVVESPETTCNGEPPG